MACGFLPSGVVHLHPTTRCNLTCGHCYSSSAPAEAAGLELDRAIDALAVLRDEGYETLSLSGGEPLLYPHFDRLVGGATELGYRVNVVTNGTLLRPTRLDALKAATLVAVSFDGAPERHDRLRGRAGAFARAARALNALAEADVPFGITCCVTRESLPDVPWLYEFASAAGAKLISLRPLAAVGRGAELAGSGALDDVDLTRLALLANVLDGHDPARPRVHADLARAADVRGQSYEAFPVLDPKPRGLPLQELVNPLIIDESGRLIPFAYGLHPRYAIGKLPTATAAIADFKRDGVVHLGELLRHALRTTPTADEAYLDWYAHLTYTSYQQARSEC